MNLTTGLLFAAPFALAIYYRRQNSEFLDKPARVKENSKDSVWMSDNLTLYIDEGPMLPVQFMPGDQYEYNLDEPIGSITNQVQALEGDSDAQLMTIANHARERETYVMGLSEDYFKPRQELLTRQVDQPRTLVSLYEGGWFEENVENGVRYWDAPLPRSIGKERWYPTQYADSLVYWG